MMNENLDSDGLLSKFFYKIRIKNQFFGSYSIGLLVHHTIKAVFIAGVHPAKNEKGDYWTYRPNWIPRSQIEFLSGPMIQCDKCREFIPRPAGYVSRFIYQCDPCNQKLIAELTARGKVKTINNDEIPFDIMTDQID